MSSEQASESAPSSAPTTEGTSPVRIILFAILGLMIVAGAYDFLWARKQPGAAADRIEQLANEPAADGQAVTKAEPITYEEAVEVIGQVSVENRPEATYYLEKYCWRSGLPWRTHDLYVVYTKSEPRLYYSCSIGQAPEPYQLPQSTADMNAQGPDARTTAEEKGDAPDAAAKEKPAAEETPKPDPAAAE